MPSGYIRTTSNGQHSWWPSEGDSHFDGAPTIIGLAANVPKSFDQHTSSLIGAISRDLNAGNGDVVVGTDEYLQVDGHDAYMWTGYFEAWAGYSARTFLVVDGEDGSSTEYHYNVWSSCSEHRDFMAEFVEQSLRTAQID